MLYFKDKTLQQYKLTGESIGTYGETVKTYQYHGDIQVDFQNENNEETRELYGVEKQNLYKIYVDSSINIDNSDKFVDENNNIYIIIGEVEMYTKFHNFQKVHLIKQRGEEL